jgi:hypothetical protein
LKDAGHRCAPVSTPVRVLKRIRNAKYKSANVQSVKRWVRLKSFQLEETAFHLLYIPELAFRPGFRQIVQALPDTS